MLQTSVYSAVMYGAVVWDCTQNNAREMSVVVKYGVWAILGLHRMHSSGGALHGDACLMPPGLLIDAAEICWYSARTPPKGAGSNMLQTLVSLGRVQAT